MTTAAVVTVVASLGLALVVAALVTMGLAGAGSVDGIGVLVLGVGVTLVTWVVGVGLVARFAFGRALPSGHRALPASATVVAMVATIVVALLPTTRQAVVPVLCTGMLVVILPLVLTGHVRARWAGWVAAVAVVATVVGVVVR